MAAPGSLVPSTWFILALCPVPRKAEAELTSKRSIRRAGAVAAAMLGSAHAAAGHAAAGDVTVRVENLRSDAGTVLVAICTPEGFLGPNCRHRGRVEARRGTAELIIGGVAPGVYAVQAIHDENDNLELDRNLIGVPREGLAISRDAPMRWGPPRFSDAEVLIGEGGGSVTLHMRYF